MKTVKEIYKIGKGPSSSHTMGPFKAVRNYLENHPDSDHLHVTLYGSLAATGKGHLTDKAIEEAYSTWKWTDRETLEAHDRRRGEVNIEWRPKDFLQVHPNGMKIASVNSDGDLYDKWTYYSIGGGDIICMEHPIENEEEVEIYDMNTMKEILDWCNKNGRTFWEYVDETEGQTYGFWEYLELVWEVMQKAVTLMTPKGILLTLELKDIRIEGDKVTCAIQKDAGDDPDTTNGILVYATVQKTKEPGIILDGGVGVGRVTKAGLSQKIGEAAINPVPKAMILREATEIAEKYEIKENIDLLKIDSAEG